MSGEGDPFGGVAQIDELLERQNEILEGLARAPVGGADGPGSAACFTTQNFPRKKRVVDLTKLVPANDTAEDTQSMPFSGFVDGIIAGWPDGADTFVGTRVTDDDTGKVYFPGGEDEWASYNDFTNIFPVSFPVKEGDNITVSFQNNKSFDIPINVSLQVFEKLEDETMDEIQRRLS